MSSSRTTAAPAQAACADFATISELSVSFPDHDMIHEIQVCGGCDWATLISIGEAFDRAQARLESVNARRYGTEGKLTTCRVRGIDDASLHDAVAAIRRLPDVRSVTVTHFLSVQRSSSSSDSAG
jgi:hypothetical protein